MTKKHILITRPIHDISTSYLHFISGELIKEINAVGECVIIDLEENQVIKKEFEKVLDKSDPRLVILNGHGSYDSVFGQKEVILDKTNIEKLKSKIVYAVVCDSCKELGEFSINQGKVEAYIGYEANYMIVIDPERSTTPMKDKNFIPFKESYMRLILSLISGRTVSQSVETTKQHIRGLIREYGIRGIKDKYGDASLIRFALYWNLFFLKALGNQEAVF